MQNRNTTPEQSASSIAYDHIREAILTGRFEPGTMLGEQPLAKELGISRTPVRTALALLQDEGWITLYPKRGALVQGLDESTISNLVETRYILESSSVQRSTPHQRAQLIERLQALIDSQQSSFDQSDIRGFIESTIAFHRAFVEISENAVLLELYDRLVDRQRFLLFRLGPRLLQRSDEIISEHQALVESLSGSTPTSFAELLKQHFSETSGIPV